MTAPSPSRVEPVAGAGALGMKLLVISLAVLFASAIASFWVVRGNVGNWTGATEGFTVPLGVWLGTGLLALLSLAMSRRMLGAGLALALLFLAAQAWNWSELIAAHLPPGAASLYAFNFYLLTGLHAAHVLGGLVFHVAVLRRARAGAPAGDGPRNLATYWHFLGVTWVALVATLVIGADPTLTSAGIAGAFGWIAGSAATVFAVCWLRTEAALLRAEGATAALVGLFPPIAFLRAFMKADELGLRGWLFWWTAAFGVALTAGSIAVAVTMSAAA